MHFNSQLSLTAKSSEVQQAAQRFSNPCGGSPRCGNEDDRRAAKSRVVDEGEDERVYEDEVNSSKDACHTACQENPANRQTAGLAAGQCLADRALSLHCLGRVNPFSPQRKMGGNQQGYHPKYQDACNLPFGLCGLNNVMPHEATGRYMPPKHLHIEH
jgi:hypothetical protein